MKKILLILCGILLSWNVCAREVAGVQLADKVQLGASNLLLNGAGVRTKFFFKIYVGALYLPQKQSSGESVIADEREHRMALHILHGLSSEKFSSGFNEAIRSNHTPAELAALDVQLQQMMQIFAAMKEVSPGDVVTLDYLPGSGTQIGVNGKVFGTVPGAAFNRALLDIWIGSKPVQEDLKKELLGG